MKKSITAIAFVCITAASAQLLSANDNALKPLPLPQLFDISGTKSGQDWKHVYLKSAEGVAINIDYKTFSQPGQLSMRTMANPIWINVMYPKLNGNEKVRVIINNILKCTNGISQYDCNKIKDNKIVDLKFAGNGRFTAQVPGELFLVQNGPYVNYFYGQQLSAVISGHWLKDPVNRTNNFYFEMK